MSKRNYAGQYFIGVAEDEGNGCNGYDIGECVWQDSRHLLCVTYAEGSAGQAVDHSMVVPVRIARHFNWFKTFAEFYEVVGGDSVIVTSNRMPNKSYNEVLYYKAVPHVNGYSGRDIAYLTRHLKEYPGSGAPMVQAIIDADEKRKAAQSLIESLVQSIEDAAFSNAELDGLIARIRPDNHFDSIPF